MKNPHGVAVGIFCRKGEITGSSEVAKSNFAPSAMLFAARRAANLSVVVQMSQKVG